MRRSTWPRQERGGADWLEIFMSPIPSYQLNGPPRRIAMITHSFYESDNRVLRYAETLARRGDLVEVAALRRSAKMPKEEVINGVRVFRLQDRPGKTEKSKLAFLGPVLRFLLVSSWWLTRRHLRARYDLVHVHNIPDFLVFAAWLPKLMGAKVLLDIHDIVPEFYASKFSEAGDSRTVKALKLVERASARFASHVILANHLWFDQYVARSAASGKCSVFINNVDGQVFQRRRRTRLDDKRIILFPGGLQWHQGLDIAIRAMPLVLECIPLAEFHIYGEGGRKEELMALARELGLTVQVRFFDPRPVSEIAEVMAQADLGVVPKRADSFGNEAYSTKIMEFMSLGVPVVASSTKIDRFYFNDSVVRFFESGNPAALAEAVVEVLQKDGLRRHLISNALDYAEQNSWQHRQHAYLALVDALIQSRPLPLDEKTADNHHGWKSPSADVAAEIDKLVVK